jgi:hypothetical protein
VERRLWKRLVGWDIWRDSVVVWVRGVVLWRQLGLELRQHRGVRLGIVELGVGIDELRIELRLQLGLGLELRVGSWLQLGIELGVELGIQLRFGLQLRFEPLLGLRRYTAGWHTILLQRHGQRR